MVYLRSRQYGKKSTYKNPLGSKKSSRVSGTNFEIKSFWFRRYNLNYILKNTAAVKRKSAVLSIVMYDVIWFSICRLRGSVIISFGEFIDLPA